MSILLVCLVSKEQSRKSVLTGDLTAPFLDIKSPSFHTWSISTSSQAHKGPLPIVLIIFSYFPKQSNTVEILKIWTPKLVAYII